MGFRHSIVLILSTFAVAVGTAAAAAAAAINCLLCIPAILLFSYDPYVCIVILVDALHALRIGKKHSCAASVCVCFVIYPSARVHATPQYYSPYYKLTLCVNYARQSKGISPSLFPESICLQWIPLNFSKQCRSVEVGWGVSSVRHCSFHHNITHYTILWPIVYCRGHAIVRLAHTHTHA